MRLSHLVCALYVLGLVKSVPVQEPPKGYKFQYSSPDGTLREEAGTFVYLNKNKENVPVLRVKGSFSYFDPTGRQIKRTYEADENGTRTKGDVIPPLVAGTGPRASTKAPEVTSKPTPSSTTPEKEFFLTLPPFIVITTTPLPPLQISSAALASLAGRK